jgi:hypothetical protein
MSPRSSNTVRPLQTPRNAAEDAGTGSADAAQARKRRRKMQTSLCTSHPYAAPISPACHAIGPAKDD